MSSEVLELLPDRKIVHASEIGGGGDGTEAFGTMTVVASLRQQQPPKGISGGGRR